MERKRLKREYLHVYGRGRPSFGGSQSWLRGRTERDFGCGLIACADVLLYLTGRTELTREEYLEFVRQCKRYFPQLPRMGIDGLRLAWGINRCFARQGLDRRAHWCAAGSQFWPRIEQMLSRDCPAVIAIGPNFPLLWQKNELPLYRRTPEGAYVVDSRVKGHYVTVTALDEQRAEVSSWGRRLYIDRQEFDSYVKKHSIWLLCNILYIE